ncbi:MAG: AsmA family protein, partial [Candidatus Binatia bacterium]
MSDTAITPALALATGINKFKKGLLIGGGAFAALLTLLLVVPHFVDLGLFKATYLPLVEDALGRRIDVGEVHLRLVPTPSIQISKLRVSDSQSYADNTFFAAQQVQLRLKFVPLLRGRFEVTELVLDKPIFNLLKQAYGSFNYSDIAGKKTPAAPRRVVRKKTDGGKKLEAMPLALPSRMSIREGQMNLVTKGQTPVNIKGIELSLKEMSGDS